MLIRIQNVTSPPHPRGCSKRTLRLPEDGNIVRCKIQAELASHLKHLKLKGLQPKAIDAYSRAIRRNS